MQKVKVELTQAEYDALSDAEKNNGSIYFITDGASNGDAGSVSYTSGASYTTGTVGSALNSKQDALTAGDNITISDDNVISAASSDPVMGETFTTNVAVGNLAKGTVINSTDKISAIVKSMCWKYIDPTDPNTRYDNTVSFTWNDSDDVDTFFNTYNNASNYTGLSLGNLITINDGTYNAQWEIAGFDMEHNQTAADGTTYNNGYGICLIPKTALTTYKWDGGYTTDTPYRSSDIHSYINGTAYNVLNIVCGSHIINRNVLLGSSQSSTSPRKWTTSAYTWTTAYLTLMSIGQMTNSFASYNNEYDDGEANYYLPVFKHENYYTGSDFWSRCVYGYDAYFSAWRVYRDGSINDFPVNYAFGVRPLMYLR